MLTLLGQAAPPACQAAPEVAHTMMVHIPCIVLHCCVVYSVIPCRFAAKQLQSVWPHTNLAPVRYPPLIDPTAPPQEAPEGHLTRSFSYVFVNNDSWPKVRTPVNQDQLLRLLDDGRLQLHITQTMPDLPTGNCAF